MPRKTHQKLNLNSIGRTPSHDGTPLEVLGLSTRAYNCLRRAGLRTVGEVATLTDEQVLSIRNLGVKTLAEIREKLRIYLASHPLPEQHPPPGPSPEPTAPDECPSMPSSDLVEPEPPPPLVDPMLLDRAAQIPLDVISIERLALPRRLLEALHHRGINSVGELVRYPAEAFDRNSPVRRQLERYLAWLVEQDKAIWAEEVAGRGISPLHRLALAETTLANLVERWLDMLQLRTRSSAKSINRDRQVIRWRYGLDGERLTLEEVGERLSVSRERVRQIEKRALSALNRQQCRTVISPLAAFLVYLLERAGSLMNESEVETALRRELVIGNVNPIGAAHLVLEINDDVKWLRKTKAWGLRSAPLDEVPGIQKWLAHVLREEHALLPVNEVISRFKATRFYRNYQGVLQDRFIIACLRVHPDIRIDEENLCGLKCWERHRIDEIVLALREIGEPAHYTMIAEKANALLDPGMRTSAHNIHAVLGRRTDLFVRVGHGIFGLKEWGLPDDGNLANAAYRVLREAGRPLHIDVITHEVLKVWRVQPGSILAAVENDARFRRIGPGVYSLREQIRGETDPLPQTDFGDLFGRRLACWQTEWDRNDAESDTCYNEVNTLRNIGLDFFEEKGASCG